MEEAVALTMCRAMVVLCVATDRESLTSLKAATVSAGWELAPGATGMAAALEQIEGTRPHVMVVFGPFEELVALAHERFPGLRIVTDRDAPGATEVATSLEEVRSTVLGLPRPSGPIVGA
jgi:hypothetical protein